MAYYEAFLTFCNHLRAQGKPVIAYDMRELARTAAELLFRRIGGDRSRPATTVLPTRLVERGMH